MENLKKLRKELEKKEIEELIKEEIDLETVCEKIENKFQEKLLRSLKEKKQSGLWKQMEEPNEEKKYLVKNVEENSTLFQEHGEG